ncbi:uncharacterized protein EDB91DRAFT_1132919 [Suillus paluster]|uniref:uncharacterized protein n=1 Tax=Suillus paluster TaxID=48578 RepID=UPI001B86CB02|nr:uncharacterized protein EDB91DRAFT_1132919 [Suillus paluster]KAG1740514.1 hypothetical protein EDB91DRAFT_1132919 [Suillus paluster]
MDPITSGLTILQVVQTVAQASALLYGYVASVRDADSSSRGLLNELRSIGGILTTVMEIEKDSSLPDNLRGALSCLMAEDGPVAKLQVELKNLLPNEQRSRGAGMIDKLKWPFKEKTAAAIVDKLKDYCREITVILEIDAWRGVQDVHRGVQKVEKDSVAKQVRENAEERRKLLKWMTPVSCKTQHDKSVDWRSAETGLWIFETDQYKIWNASDCAFLWLNGQPGAGKTILTSAVIDKIRGDGQAEPQTLAYFYCNFRDEQTTVAAAVLRTLIFYLLQESKDDWITKIGKPEQQRSDSEGNFVSLRKLAEEYRDGNQCSTDLGFLRKLLVEVSKLVPRPVLVIDALDECKDYCNLLGHLATLAQDARLRLFVTGRIEPDIKDTFHHLPTVSLKEKGKQMKEDIRVHINKQLQTQKRLSRLDEELRIAILEKLLEKADGIIRKALDNLPKGLYETYDRIIHSIEERSNDDGPIAKSCLLWLAGALTPLTLDQLNEALMIEVGKSSLNPELRANDPMDIVVACGSFVTYDEATGVVGLSHYSVKEYLISPRPNSILKSISDVHARICELSITYLLCDFVGEMCAKAVQSAAQAAARNNTRHPDHPLLNYAVGGLKHLRHVSDEDPAFMATLSRLQPELPRTAKHIDMLGYPALYRWSSVTSPSPLFVPIGLGTPWMVEFLVKQQPDVLDIDIASCWGSPLIFAISENPDMLDILLKLGIDRNKPSSFTPRVYGWDNPPDGSYPPISWAAAIRSKVALDFLLLRTKANLPDDILHVAIAASRVRRMSRMFRAIWVSTEVIRKCRQHGADVNFTVNGSTPIHTFLSNQKFRFLDLRRRLLVVQALVEPSCNLSMQDLTARTVLHIALDRHLENVVEYLLEQNAQLSATATLHPDMWSWAKNETWFPKIQAAILAADRPCTRIRGKVVDTTQEFLLVEFPGAVNAAREYPNPICAVVISAILYGPSK